MYRTDSRVHLKGTGSYGTVVLSIEKTTRQPPKTLVRWDSSRSSTWVDTVSLEIETAVTPSTLQLKARRSI